MSSEAVSVVRCDQRARRSVNETAMSDERAAQRRVECTLHAVVWFVMSAVVVNCCPGRRCRIVKSRSRRGAAQRCRCTCACVCCQHTSIARRRRALPRSLPTTTTTTTRPERRLQCAVLNADSAPACCVGSSAAWCLHHSSTSQQQLRRRASSCAACSNRWRPPSRTPSSARRCTISPVKFNVDEVGARPCTSTATPTRTALGDGGSAMELGAKFNSNALLIGVLLLKCRSTSPIAACRSSSVHVAVRHALAADGRRVRQRHSLRRPSLASW